MVLFKIIASLMLQMFTINFLSAIQRCPIQSNSESEINTIDEFDDFKELDFNYCSKNDTLLYLLYIKPNKKIILNDLLDFKSAQFQTPKIYFFVFLENFNGFEITSNPFSRFKITYKFDGQEMHNNYILTDSNFQFYFRNKLINQELCDDRVFRMYKNNFLINIFFLDASSPNVIFTDRTCSLVFYQARIQYLILSSSGSSLALNSLRFYNITPKTEYFDSIIGYFELNLYHEDLNNEILNEHVFKVTQIMTFNGIIHTIDENVFKPFKKLRTLRIKSQNIRNTFQKNNRWLQHLNTNVNIKDFDSLDNEKLLDILFTLAIEQPHPNVTYYSYPNEDLCYFKDFPHHRLILPILKPILTSNFSYTYLFLMHQSRRIETYLNSKLNSLLNTNYESSTYIIELRSYIPIETINSDYFQFINKTLSQCQPHSIVREDTNFYFYLFDYRLLKKYVEIVFSLILNPLFSFICLILNIVSIRIFSDKKIENKAIYRFLIANSIFVCLQTAIICSHLFYVCTEEFVWNDTHLKITLCFQTMHIISRYYYIIFIRILANCIRTCSNISYTFFTLRRYIDITNTKNTHLMRFKKSSIKSNIFITILISLLINSYLYFEFSTKDLTLEDKRFMQEDINKRPDYNELNDYTEDMSPAIRITLQTVNIAKIILADLVLMLIGIIIDFSLFLFVKRKPRIENLVSTIAQTRRAKNEKKCEKRLSSSIILNGINFLLFRTPSLILSFYGFVYRYDASKNQHFPDYHSYFICRSYKLCNAINEFTTFLYLLSFIVQFYIFYKFDMNFKRRFKKLF